MWSDRLDTRMSARDLKINRREAEREWSDEARVNCFVRFWLQYCSGKSVWLSRQELKRKTEEMIGHSISDQAFQIGLYLADLEVKDRVKLPLWQENVVDWWREDLTRLEKQITEQNVHD
jgi:hypothetical protein